MTAPEWIYLAGLAFVEVYGTWIHPLVLSERLPFLPLMLVSTYCAAGMVWIWAQPDVLEVQVPKRG